MFEHRFVACIAQVVNALAPLMTETGGRIWKQTTWYPLEHASRFGRGELVFTAGSGPEIDTPRYGLQPAVETIVTRDPETGSTTLFAINRSVTDAIPMAVSLFSNHPLTLVEGIRLHSEDPNRANTADQPNCVVPVAISDAAFANNQLDNLLPALSWNVYRFEAAND